MCGFFGLIRHIYTKTQICFIFILSYWISLSACNRTCTFCLYNVTQDLRNCWFTPRPKTKTYKGRGPQTDKQLHCKVLFQRRYDMNGRSQMQGGKNWILSKVINANRFFWGSHWLEIWKNLLCPSMGRERRYGLRFLSRRRGFALLSLKLIPPPSGFFSWHAHTAIVL